MGMNFPDVPTNGQVFGIYTWDGEKWVVTPTAAGGGPSPSNTNPIMDGTAAPGVAAPYSRGDHVHPSDTTKAATTYVDTQDALKLSKSANLSDVADATTSRKSIYAAPFDALAYNGMQINGSMEVSQELGYGTWSALNGTYACDGWIMGYSGAFASGVSLSPESLAPGFDLCLFLAVGAPAQASLGASDVYYLKQSIEGHRVKRLAFGLAAASPITIGFWSKNTPAGVYSVAVQNGSGTIRSYVATYTQVVAGVSQYNVITVPGDTAGVWATDNTIGLGLTFTLAAGSTTTAPSANTWLTGNYIAAPGQINGVNSTANSLKITGVVVLPGLEAPSAARSALIMRPFDQELATCKRYWEKFQVGFVGSVTAGLNYGTSFVFSVEKRAAPTLISVLSSAGGGFPTTLGSMLNGVNLRGGTYYKAASATTTGGSYEDILTADARL